MEMDDPLRLDADDDEEEVELVGFDNDGNPIFDDDPRFLYAKAFQSGGLGGVEDDEEDEDEEDEDDEDEDDEEDEETQVGKKRGRGRPPAASKSKAPAKAQTKAKAKTTATSTKNTPAMPTKKTRGGDAATAVVAASTSQRGKRGGRK